MGLGSVEELVPGGQSTGRGYDALSAQRARARKKRLQELMAENYQDIKIEIPVALLKGGPKAGKTTNTRRVLGSKRSVASHMEEDPKSTQRFLAAAAKSSRYPAKPKCSICGYKGDVTCTTCGSRYCSLACGKTHSQMRCLR